MGLQGASETQKLFFRLSFFFRQIWGTIYGDHQREFDGSIEDAVKSVRTVDVCWLWFIIFLQDFFKSVANRFRQKQTQMQEACGDFQLMHRNLWFHLRGYWERPTYGHFDTVLNHVAEYENITMDVFEFPLILYHQV